MDNSTMKKIVLSILIPVIVFGACFGITRSLSGSKQSSGNPEAAASAASGSTGNTESAAGSVGGAFSDMKTNVQIVAEGMLSSPAGRTRWQTMSHEDKIAKLNERAKTDKRAQAMIAAFGADVVVSMIDDAIN